MTLGFEALLAVYFATAVLVLKPGPYVLSIVSIAAHGHWGRLISFLCGSYTGGTFIYLLLLTGLSAITQYDLGFVFFLLKAVAAAWFIWLGIKGLLKNHIDEQATKDREEKFSGKSVFENFVAGFILTCSNPYDILFVTGVIPALVGHTTFTLGDIFGIRAAVILAEWSMLAIYIVPVVLLRRYIKAGQIDLLRIVASILMIGVGLYIGYTAIMADDLLTSGVMG